MNFLRQGDPEIASILLAHGAGAPMDSPFMEDISGLLVEQGFEVIRFEFPYMSERRETGKKRPPDRAPKLLAAFHDAVTAIGAKGRLIIGGKSMGGRMATMLAAESDLSISGVLCLGYPFHAPGKPEKLRVDHLSGIKVPTLILQGERDPFGGTTLMTTLSLPDNIEVSMIPDGNHDLAPRKRSAFTHEGNMVMAAKKTRSFFSAF